MAVDESNEHVMSVWDWQKTDRGQRITEVKVRFLSLCVYVYLVLHRVGLCWARYNVPLNTF